MQSSKQSLLFAAILPRIGMPARLADRVVHLNDTVALNARACHRRRAI